MQYIDIDSSITEDGRKVVFCQVYMALLDYFKVSTLFDVYCVYLT